MSKNFAAAVAAFEVASIGSSSLIVECIGYCHKKRRFFNEH